MKHEVIECGSGVRNLRRALAEIDQSGREVVSVVANQGGTLMSLLGSGDSFGFLIVVRSRVLRAANMVSDSDVAEFE